LWTQFINKFTLRKSPNLYQTLQLRPKQFIRYLTKVWILFKELYKIMNSEFHVFHTFYCHFYDPTMYAQVPIRKLSIITKKSVLTFRSFRCCLRPVNTSYLPPKLTILQMEISYANLLVEFNCFEMQMQKGRKNLAINM